jgi:predicted MFS family arabinose efflux permease
MHPGAVALPITLLASAAFLSSAGTRVVDPLLHVIATDFAVSVPAVSVLIAAFTLPYGFCQILLGPLGDRFGKLRVMLVALTAYSIVTGACAFATSLPALAILRGLAGAASAAIIPVGMAYIADAVAYKDRQVTLSRYLNGIVLTQLVAGPLGGVFGEYIGWRGVFLVLAAGGLVVAAVMARQLPSLPDRRSGTATFSLANYIILLRPGLPRVVLLAGFIDGIVLMGSFPFLAPYMHEAFGLDYFAVGMILACFGLGALLYTRTAHILVPRLGEPGLVMLGGAVLACGIALAVLTPIWQLWIVVQGLLGFGFFLLHGVLQARATEMLPAARATAVASFAFTLFAGQSVGALAMGVLIAHTDYQTAFACDAIAILALGLWLSATLRKLR